MYKAVIFDLDGTLINSLDDLADAVNYGLNKMKLPPYPTEAYKKFVGSGAIKLCERALKGKAENQDAVNTLHSYFSEYYDVHCLDKSAPYPGIPELISKLKDLGIRMAVASNKPDEFTNFIIKKMFPENTFSVVFGKRPSRDVKPAPDIVYDIIDKLCIPKDEIFLAGDSDIDIITAKNAGIKSVGCTWGFRGKSELIAAGADYTVDFPEEIIKFFK